MIKANTQFKTCTLISIPEQSFVLACDDYLNDLLIFFNSLCILLIINVCTINTLMHQIVKPYQSPCIYWYLLESFNILSHHVGYPSKIKFLWPSCVNLNVLWHTTTSKVSPTHMTFWKYCASHNTPKNTPRKIDVAYK
jgi:hypothetical protein